MAGRGRQVKGGESPLERGVGRLGSIYIPVVFLVYYLQVRSS
jgi:hypothetical protein